MSGAGTLTAPATSETIAPAGPSGSSTASAASDPSSPTTPDVPAGRRYLVAPSLDGWLVGGFAIVAWLLFVGLPGVPSPQIPALQGAVLWALLAIIATHFGVSFHLAYGQGREVVRRHGVALIAIPVALVVFAAGVVLAMALDLAGVAGSGARIGLVAVYSLTTWHYVKQTYGVVRIGASLHDIALGPRVARVFRFGLYPLWWFEASTVWSRGYVANDYGFDASFTLLPESTVVAFRVGSMLSMTAIAASLLLIAVQQRRRLPATVWSPYAVALLWIVWQPDHVSAVLVLGAAHALQYLACAHRVEVVWGAERREPRTMWWCSVFGGALATGMLLTYWLPMWLGYAGGAQLGVTMAAMLFVVFNLHHYAIDAVLWRSRDGHVRRITRGPSTTTPAPH